MVNRDMRNELPITGLTDREAMVWVDGRAFCPVCLKEGKISQMQRNPTAFLYVCPICGTAGVE